LLHCARASRCAALDQEQVDDEHEEHQNACKIDRRFNKEICCAANAKDCADSAWSGQSASEALALSGLGEYDKSEEDRYEDRENYCNRVHLGAKTLMLKSVKVGSGGPKKPILAHL
jgi:hypothetical protein